MFLRFYYIKPLFNRREFFFPKINIFFSDFSACKTRRVDLTISASYGDDVNTVLDALLENVSKHELVLQDPAPFVGINKYGTSSIEYVARVWCESANYWTVYFDLQKGFADMFKAKGIHMTYDHINVHIEKDQ